MLRKITLFVFLLMIGMSVTYGQVGQGALKGKVTDKESGDPLPFVNIVLELNGNIIAGGATDFDGKYNIKPIPPGKYDLKVKFIGYKPVQINGIVVNSSKITFNDVKLSSSAIEMDVFEVIEYTVPLISKDNTTSGGTVTREDINKMPGRSAASVAATVGGVGTAGTGGALSIRGARTSGTTYYIDGIKVTGGANLPQAAIQEVSVLLGGIPAQYGDITGGIIAITSRGASRTYSGGFEYITSGYKIGDDVYGLDNFGYNLLEFNASGPILFKKDTAGKKTDPLVGFFLAGNISHVVDGSPSAIGSWKLKDDVRQDIIDNPLRFNALSSGANDNHDFLRLSDFEKTNYRLNAGSQSLTGLGRLDFNTGKTTNLTIGGTIDYNSRNSYSFGNSMMNADNNGTVSDITWRTYIRFTQRFNAADNGDDAKSSKGIKNAFYSVQFDYTQRHYREQNKKHQDRLFNYGYAGKFKSFNHIFYARQTVTLPEYNIEDMDFYVHEVWEDTLIGFTPSDINPVLSNVTASYYDLFDWEGYDANGNPIYDWAKANTLRNTFGAEVENIPIRSVEALQLGQAYVNGDPLRSVYGMYSGPASTYNGYSKFDQSQVRLSAIGSADIGDHEISVGFEWEQRDSRNFGMSGAGARGLWTVGRQLMNTHIDNRDTTKPQIDRGANTITYPRLNGAPGAYTATDAQYLFDYNVRKALGLKPDEMDWVDFNNYDPSTYKLDFFSADELLNGGSDLVSYYGYDAWGNALDDDPIFDDYFKAAINGNDKDDDGIPDEDAYDIFGNPLRKVGSFRPIYMAGYIQDKFSFDDLIFNIGIRVDRFDANQKVLKDPFVMFPTIKAGDAESLKLLSETANGAHPGTVGEDYVVYVDDVSKPTKIMGYRNGITWYDAEGTETQDLDKLKTSGNIAPLLKDKNQKAGKDIRADSFEDYTPQVNIMPRIAFSFPVSEEALFFAHYDVLTQRPTSGLRVNPRNYFFIETLSTGSNVVTNPSLKPQKSIDYELGFQQKLTNSSSLKLAAFYKEQRDMIANYSFTEAYPQTYISYNNIDFSTLKGFTATYDLRRTGNIWMRVAYTLQFAEGTGSNATSGLGLVRAGRPNLRSINPLNYDQRHRIVATVDYRFGDGKDYNGPVWFGKQVMKNTGANFVLNAGSGVPFSRSTMATATATGSGNGPLDGTLNGSRLPWQSSIDARFDRDMTVTLGKDDKAKTIMVNFYFQVLNLLDQLNITGVYRFTGNPDDDGYLASARAQKNIAEQNNELAFREYYTTSVNFFGNYTTPRRFRVGVMVTF